MEMSNSEIRKLYAESKDKWQQIGILADLNDCTKEEIARIVADIDIDNKICELRVTGMAKGNGYIHHRDSNEVRGKFYKGFGERLAKAISKKNISRAELAEKANITPANISYYAHGLKIPDAFTLHKITSVLEISADELLGAKKYGNDKRRDSKGI